MSRCLGVVTATLALALALPAAAGAAVTLGTTTQPSDSTPGECGMGGMAAQFTSDPGTPYSVPEPGGTITQWQTNTAGDTAGQPLELVVLGATGNGSYTVVAIDAEAVPKPLPADGIATFTPPTPLPVGTGDVVGLYQFGNGAQNCYWSGGSISADDGLGAFEPSSPPAPGQSVSPLATLPNSVVDVSATVVLLSQDAGVTTSVGPASAAPGRLALLSSTVGNQGPGTGPITFVDHVPSGLTIDAAAGSGGCSISGQTVTCTITGLAVGQSTPVDVVVTPSAAGAYSNSVSVAVAAGTPDPNPANNAASATLVVGSPPSTVKCLVPQLKGAPSGLAKTVLTDLACKVKVSHSHSSAVHKGLVITTKPGAGTYAAQTTVTLLVSSGPKKKKHHK
jgi:uncharacterized protein DUF11/PASTA domain-containing protein